MAAVAERIATEAKTVRIWPMVLVVLLAPLLAIGWLAGKIVLAFRYLVATVKVGYKSATGVSDGATR